MTRLLEPEDTISLYRGSSKTIELFVIDDEKEAPVKIPGASLYFTVRKSIDSDAPVLFKSTASITQIEITTPLAGVAEIHIQPSDTLSLTPGIYVYDVWIVLASGNTYILVEPSEFIIKKGVTRF